MISMFDRREKNIEIFKDSMELMKNNYRLNKSIDESISKQKLYLESDVIEIPDSPNKICKIVVSKKRSFEAASEYAKLGKRVCVLNFASSTNPGGGVTRGSSAQEECLCRCSTLYPCLNNNMMWQQFYKPHRNAENPLYNDDCLYSPAITVFKSDVSVPERLEEKDWYQVDIITCAAPNLRNVPSNTMNPFAGKIAAKLDDNDLLEIHLKRIERIFSIAVVNGAEILILGAFGCGAFCNPPSIVANAFKIVQDKYLGYFETIEYAVFCRGNETENFDEFCRKLR